MIGRPFLPALRFLISTVEMDDCSSRGDEVARCPSEDEEEEEDEEDEDESEEEEEEEAE